jgi:4-oxalocrotonate tautomerase
MPLVRIAYSSTLSLASGSLLSSVVQRCLSETFNVPQNDLFHIVTEHEIGRALICTPEFLGISHGSSPVFIQITCSEGRSIDQKKALYAEIAQEVAVAVDISSDDVIINLIETKRENWSFGRGLAQYA